MKVLDLFSGIGGFSLGLERAGMQTVTFCEIDKFCQQVLKKHWPNVPIYENIFDLDGKKYVGAIDLICGGFPCQPFSVAGKQKGKDDNRHLWPEMFRVIKEAKPTWFIGENVPGIVNLALEQVCADLEGEGYGVETLIIPACAVNAPHRRSRVWIIAHSKHLGWDSTAQQASHRKTICESEEGQESTRKFEGMDTPTFVANATSTGLERENRNKSPFPHFTGFDGWQAEPTICRKNNGLPSGVDGIRTIGHHRQLRIKALGNAVVPQIPEILGKYIMEVERTTKEWLRITNISHS